MAMGCGIDWEAVVGYGGSVVEVVVVDGSHGGVGGCTADGGSDPLPGLLVSVLGGVVGLLVPSLGSIHAVGCNNQI
jgi:hypothetical protein